MDPQPQRALLMASGAVGPRLARTRQVLLKAVSSGTESIPTGIYATWHEGSSIHFHPTLSHIIGQDIVSTPPVIGLDCMGTALLLLSRRYDDNSS